MISPLIVISENLNMGEIYQVVYPIGPQTIQNKKVADAIHDLNGKTICELWNYAFRGDDSFLVIEKMMKDKYPDVKFIRYENFGNIHDPSEEAKMMAELPAKLKKFKCDAVIAGNGG